MYFPPKAGANGDAGANPSKHVGKGFISNEPSQLRLRIVFRSSTITNCFHHMYAVLSRTHCANNYLVLGQKTDRADLSVIMGVSYSQAENLELRPTYCSMS